MIRHLVSRIATAGALIIPLLAHAAAPTIEVFKSASCGCCAKWVKHLEANGFSVKTQDVANPADYRQKAGIPDSLGSCHTALVRGYAIEGHVPAADIKRLLAETPRAKGLAVPGMPLGSPGMEGPRKDPYEVLLVQADGRTTVYKRYN
ncbi:DUF411 domain-containing protein [Pseudoduganella umbonata]|uniref:DUF411 domain-containing protein n=1 Tax=Pseudoduganella umbonata TaxID=864828 RepID=A0A4P8HUT9_9BURK|nr:DUF411 domain-containing protein [Pseudoduganella umbonata]MBB3222100.1 hypothetical protein [Pseudoduganella umbonata]QCP12340.1 DUF411 domain-containing protein [Pseudoduganella umbonata]